MVTLGLILACFGSVFNVLTDCTRKKILDHHYDAALIGFWCKVVALVCYLIALGVLVACGVGVALPPIGASKATIERQANIFLNIFLPSKAAARKISAAAGRTRRPRERLALAALMAPLVLGGKLTLIHGGVLGRGRQFG